MERLRYLDFELKIERQGEQYLARVLRSPAGEASGTFVLPFSEDRLEVLVLKLGRLRGSTRRIHSAEEAVARELGGKLFEAVFGRELLACLKSSLERTSSRQGMGLRLKLRLQDVAELADLPWEFLFDTSVDRFLAQSNRTPIVRYMEMPERIRPLTLRPPLHVLVMISSPTDYQRLDVKRERALLEEALGQLSKQGKVQIDYLENATLAALQRRLRDEVYHVFHFIGHGGFDRKADEGVLVLEDEQGHGWQAAAHRIATLLHDHPSLRLAVLNSCEGARNSRTDPFAGVATTLIRQGVPAVVAMQFEITDHAAITFANEFYAALAEGFPVDAAVAETRKAIYVQPNDVEWGTPVLYMRSSDGVLFKLPQPSPSVKTLPLVSALPEREEVKQPEEVAAAEENIASRIAELAKDEEKQAFTDGEENLPDSMHTSMEEPTNKKPKPDIALIKSEAIGSTVRVLKGHTKQVNSVAFSPDGTMLASASGGEWGRGDDTVRLWRVSDGTLLNTLKGHTDQVSSVAFSPDGATLASGGFDFFVRLWRVSDGTILNTLKERNARVHSVAFSPDGVTLASSGETDFSVRLWRVSDGKPINTLQGHTLRVNSMTFSPDGTTLAAGAWDRTLCLWRVSDWTLLNTLKGHTNEINSVAFSPDGTKVASGSADQTVRLWRVSDGTLLSTVKASTRRVTSVAFSPDGTILASGSEDQTVRLWHVSDGTLLYTLHGHTKQVNSVVFSPDGTMLASGSFDQTVRLWSVS